MNETYWHLAAYSESLTNGLTNTAVDALLDNVLTRTAAGNFILPQPGKLAGMYSAGVNLTRARVNTPSLRYVGLPFGGLINATLATPSPPNLTWWGDNGPTIPTADEISVEHTLGGVAPEQEYSLVWFQFNRREVPAAPTYRILATATITATANAWTSGNMTLDSTLPAGRYAVVGMTAFGTNLNAARLIFPGGGYRPGCLSMNANNGVALPHFTDGRMGVYGTFDSVNTPTLEILASGANTAQTVFLDLQRIGGR